MMIRKRTMKSAVMLSLILASGVVGLTGCGDKVNVEELQAQIEQDASDKKALEEQVSDLQAQLDKANGMNDDSTSICSYDTESQTGEVKDVDSLVQTDGVLEYTGSYQAPNSGSLNLTDSISVVPSNSWTMKIDGSKTYFSHPQGVYGVIKISSIDEEVDSAYFEDELMNPFLEALQSSGSKVDRIYVDDHYAGLSAEVVTTSNDKPSILKCGVFGKGTNACVYCFYYAGKKDNTKSDLVDSLLNSMTFNRGKVSVN